MRCRDPDERRHAIAMLRSAYRREGVWDGFAAAAVLERAVEIEEEGLAKVEKASDVPDEQRIYFADPAAGFNKRQIHI
jgi:hypothetical protein